MPITLFTANATVTFKCRLSRLVASKLSWEAESDHESHVSYTTDLLRCAATPIFSRLHRTPRIRTVSHAWTLSQSRLVAIRINLSDRPAMLLRHVDLVPWFVHMSVHTNLVWLPTYWVCFLFLFSHSFFFLFSSYHSPPLSPPSRYSTNMADKLFSAFCSHRPLSCSQVIDTCLLLCDSTRPPLSFSSFRGGAVLMPHNGLFHTTGQSCQYLCSTTSSLSSSVPTLG